jgi:predicted dinucleotide-utilizing enzyme
VIREYIGGGVLGEIAALQDEYERRQREEEAAFCKEERERLEDLMAPIDELCEAAEVLARAALVAAGYRRHNRGEWRKRREPQQR